MFSRGISRTAAREARFGSVTKSLQEGHMYRVLQVTPELNAGGVERTTIELAEAISRAGGLALVASAGGRLEGDLKAAGGELIRLPMHTKNPIEVALNARRLSHEAKLHRVNLIHARSRMPGWSAYWAARELKLPFVTTYHGIYNARSAPKRWYNSVMAKGDIVIANSEFTRQHVIAEHKIDPARVVAIPRGVDLERFDRSRISVDEITTMRASWGMTADDKRLVLIAPARLTRWKGQLVLIEALAQLQKRKPNALRVILAGDAQGRMTYVQDLNDAIERASLRESVALVGHLGHINVAFAAADFAVFPVIEPEAFGRGAVEAQVMGLPVIASKLGGYTETVVDGETGLLVAHNDASALAAAIERLIEAGAPARAAMGQKGKDRACLLYAKTALQSSTLKVYDRLLGERP
ncbi:glycosyltransferase [alpha proteobacterium U9-1i]|nr:glycosyltransferase [alpha proteobacterium U9-1i]